VKVLLGDMEVEGGQLKMDISKIGSIVVKCIHTVQSSVSLLCEHSSEPSVLVKGGNSVSS
jgi:hypothetical protein